MDPQGQTQEQLDAMPMDQLEALVNSEGPAPQGEATGTQQAQGESTGQAEPTEQKAPVDETPAWFKAFDTNLKRELGSFRGLQGQFDKLPGMVQQQIQQQLAKLQQAQQNANLSPEDRDAQAQLQAQQDTWSKFVQDKADERAKAVFGESAKPYIDYLNKQMEREADNAFKSQTLDQIKEMIPEGAEQTWEELFKGVHDDIVAGKPGAIERFDRLANNKDATALAMIQLQRSKVSSQAQQVTQNRSNLAKQAAQSPKGAAVTSQGKRNVAEMDQSDLDKLSIAELEAAIPE